jgi:peptide/nickel transport system substrate-binding protein
VETKSRALAAILSAAFVGTKPVTGLVADTPRLGGILIYVIPADAPPSWDAHRETTFATIHSAAASYSVLIRVDPNDPSSMSDLVCDLCTSHYLNQDFATVWLDK